MNKLRSVILLVVIAFSLSMVAQDATNDAPFDKGEYVGLFPIFQPNFKPQFSIAPQTAFMSFKDLDSSGFGYGAEIALMCPLATPKKNYIRQQLSFLSYSDDAFKHWNVTSNIEYRLIANPAFELAFGPAFGIAHNELENTTFSTNKFTYGASTSATFHFNKMFVGISGRYMAVSKEEFGLLEYNFNSVQALLKLGFKL